MKRAVLPVVTEELADSFLRDLAKNRHEVVDFAVELDSENPVVMGMIKFLAENSTDFAAVFSTSVMLYKVLRVQAEIDSTR